MSLHTTMDGDSCIELEIVSLWLNYPVWIGERGFDKFYSADTCARNRFFGWNVTIVFRVTGLWITQKLVSYKEPFRISRVFVARYSKPLHFGPAHTYVHTACTLYYRTRDFVRSDGIGGSNDVQVFYVFVDLIAINRLFIIRQYRKREMYRLGCKTWKRERGIRSEWTWI